jgi:Lambda phage tail tape-measure protein (Tape_meas_lam_C)
MAIKVGTLQVDLIAGTATFTGPLDKAPKQARQSAQDIQKEFNNIDLSEARGTLALLSDDIGLTLPRHLRSFVAELPGVSAALSAAFPVAAIIAAGVAIFEFTEKILKQKEAQEKANREIEEQSDSLKTHAMQMELDTMRIEDQIAVIEGRPTRNKVKEALHEARIEAIGLADALDKTAEKVLSTLEKASVGNFATLATGGATDKKVDEASAKIKKIVEDTQKWKDAIASNNGALADSLKKTIEDEVAALNTLQGTWKATTDKLVQSDVADHKKLPRRNEPDPVAAAESRQVRARQIETSIANFTEAIQSELTGYYTREAEKKHLADVQTMQDSIELSNKQYASEKKLQDARTGQAIAADELRFQQGKITAEELTALKDASLNVQYTAERAHLEKIKQLEAGKPALVKITEQEIEALDAAHQAKLLMNVANMAKEEQRIMLSQTEATIAQAEKENQAKIKATVEFLEFYKRYEAAAQRIAVLETEISDQKAAQATKLAVATGKMTEQKAASQELATLEKNKADAMDKIVQRLNEQFDLVQRLKALTNGGATGTDDQKQQYQKAVEDYQAMKQKQLEIEKKFDAQINGVVLTLANNEQSQWMKLLNGWDQVSTRISQLGRQTFEGLTTSLSNFIVTGQGGWKNLAVSALTSLTEIEIQHLAAFALQKTLASQQQLIHAKSAFWNAYDATSGIPIIGPALAPAAGAAAFAAVMAFEKGGIVPRDSLSLVHAQEMVLPRPISTFIMGAVSNASSAGTSSSSSGAASSAGHHFVFAPTIQAVDADGVDRMLTKHADTFQRHVTKQLRQLHIKR